MRPNEYNYPCNRQGCPGVASLQGRYCNKMCVRLDEAFRWVIRISEREGLTPEDVDYLGREWDCLLNIAEAIDAWRVLVNENAQRRLNRAA